MPKLYHREQLGPTLRIGVQIGYGTKDIDNNGVWTAVVKFPGYEEKVRSTKIKYGGGNEELRKQAIKIAWEIHAPIAQDVGEGRSLDNNNAATVILDLFIDDIDRLTTENIEFGNRHRIVGGKAAYWTYSAKKKVEHHSKTLREFFVSLEKPNRRRINHKVNLKSITQRDWDKYHTFVETTNPGQSIETYLQYIQSANRFLNWAYAENHLDVIPRIKRHPRGGVEGARARMRREITETEYFMMVQWTRDNYQDPQKLFQGHRDFRYLFHLWFMIIANTGHRPGTGGTEHTMMQWEDVSFDGDGVAILKRQEKNHKYEAVILPNAIKYFDRLREFYEEDLGMACTGKDYLFRHTMDKVNTKTKEYIVRKGDPIINFRGQWNKMIEDLKLAPPKKGKVRRKQSEMVSPSSLRAFFSTQRLYNNDDQSMDLLKLAEAQGTSPDQLRIRYARLDTRRSYKELTAGAFFTPDNPQYREIDGRRYYVGTMMDNIQNSGPNKPTEPTDE